MNKSVKAFVAGLCLVSPLLLAQPAGGKPSDKQPAEAVPAEKADPVKLQSPGAEPRRVLRYAPAKGDAYGFEMRMKMGMSMTMGGEPAPSTAMPTMVMPGDVKVVDVLPGGSVKLDFVYAEGKLAETEGVMPQVIEAMETSMRQLKGLNGSFVFTSRGEYVSGSFRLPTDADPMVKQTLQGLNKSMEQMTVPLPAEPVGKGARWTCERNPENNGVKMKALYTHELVEQSDKSFSAKVSIDGEAGEQTVQGMKLEGMKMTGSGNMKMDLARLMPTDCRLVSKVSMSMDGGAQGKMTMDMDLTMTMKVTEPTGAKPAPSEPDKPKAPKF
ncbi:MAG TPA: DUF6263 family protein [Phycisphaerales bacterium]|nr:DUF6263 family protein [Phycisphaerales bacterium]